MGTRFFVSETVLIDRPIEQVFAYTTDYRNDVYWRQGVIAMKVNPVGQAGVGTKTTEVLRAYGRQLLTEAEVTGFVPNQRADFRAISGPMPVSGSRIFEARGEQTLVTYAIEGELDAVFSLLWPLLRKSYRRQVAGDLQHLKQRLEMTVPEAAPVFAPQ